MHFTCGKEVIVVTDISIIALKTTNLMFLWVVAIDNIMELENNNKLYKDGVILRVRGKKEKKINCIVMEDNLSKELYESLSALLHRHQIHNENRKRKNSKRSSLRSPVPPSNSTRVLDAMFGSSEDEAPQLMEERKRLWNEKDDNNNNNNI